MADCKGGYSNRRMNNEWFGRTDFSLKESFPFRGESSVIDGTYLRTSRRAFADPLRRRLWPLQPFCAVRPASRRQRAFLVLRAPGSASWQNPCFAWTRFCKPWHLLPGEHALFVQREGVGAIQRRCGCSAGAGWVVAISGQSPLSCSSAHSRPWLSDCGQSSIWNLWKTGCLPPAECPATRPIPRIQLTFAVGLGLHSAKLTFRPTNPTAGLRISGSLLRGHFEGRYPTCTTETPCQN